MQGAISQKHDFWSRRKAGVAAEEEAIGNAALQSEAEAAEAACKERSDEEILADLNLPMPEALDTPEAVRRFVNAAVPRRLKNRAFRRLWRLNPIVTKLDGLVDYGEDFTDSATVVENLQTAYQVGKGMLDKLGEFASDDSAAGSDSNPAEEAGDEPDASKDEAAADAETTLPPSDVLSATEDCEVEIPRPAQRRMRFSFVSANEGLR